MAEEGRYLLRGTAEAEGAAGSPVKAKKDGKVASVRGFLVTMLTALAVYLIATAVSRAVIWDGVASETVVGEGDTSKESTTDSTTLPMLAGLVNPNNGSRPSLTTTSDCVGGGLGFTWGFDLDLRKTTAGKT